MDDYADMVNSQHPICFLIFITPIFMQAVSNADRSFNDRLRTVTNVLKIMQWRQKIVVKISVIHEQTVRFREELYVYLCDYILLAGLCSESEFTL